MATIHLDNLIVPVHASTPEFRAAHNAYGKAYSGPEQRRRMPHMRSHSDAAHDDEFLDAAFAA